MKKKESITARYFASNLKRLRSMHKLTLKEAGERIGVTQSTMFRYEKLDYQFAFPAELDIVDRLASLYQVKIADLFAPECAAEQQLRLGGTVEDAIYIVNRKIANGEIKMLLQPGKDPGFPIPASH